MTRLFRLNECYFTSPSLAIACCDHVLCCMNTSWQLGISSASQELAAFTSDGMWPGAPRASLERFYRSIEAYWGAGGTGGVGDAPLDAEGAAAAPAAALQGGSAVAAAHDRCATLLERTACYLLQRAALADSQCERASLACTECLLHGILPQECLNPPVALHWRCLYPHAVPPVLPSDARHHEGILAMLLTICDGLRAPGSCGVLRGKARGGVHAMQGAWPGARSPCC